ncbi:MAG: radical SAM protein [Candidatus Bathyarchaeia archaeon]|jgi:putative pyruvate formate lyase activating enzyme
MRCLYCQNWTISQWVEDSAESTPKELAKDIERLRLGGCRNINLVGGEPTPWLPLWLETFKHVTVNVPIVWNSNAYYSPETSDLLAGFADVYLLDFKYGPGNCAKRLSDASDFWSVCTRNHLAAKQYGELIVRVLVLPAHLQCCLKPILDWIAKNLGVKTRVNLMFQYRPQWRAKEAQELCKKLTVKEMETSSCMAKKAGLINLVT